MSASTQPINSMSADIDIDFPTTFNLNSVINHAIPASMVRNGELVKHPCGYYFQSIPIDPHTKLAAIPYQAAEQLGYFKIDFLHLSLLDSIKSKSEMRSLIAKPPNWELLQDPGVVSKLFQIHKNAELLRRVKPNSVNQLADTIALIRPGKKHLIARYLKDPDSVRGELYRRDGDGYYFKKSHAVSYALTIVAQLHLIEQGRL